MELVMQSATLVAGITVLSCVPLLFTAVQKYSNALFLTGTGAMFGICFFDLLPDVFEKGGTTSIAIVATVFISYSVTHGVNHTHGSQQRFLVLFTSLLLHCFASGMFLALSRDSSVNTSESVFLVLCIHKSYEAIMFSFILIDRKFSRYRMVTALALYAGALPLGVALTWLFIDHVTEHSAIALSSVAVGSLIACLMFDFLFPSVQKTRFGRSEIAFLLLGLVFTQIMLRGV